MFVVAFSLMYHFLNKKKEKKKKSLNESISNPPKEIIETNGER